MLLSHLDFGSLLAYTPRGTSEEAKRSKNLMYDLKREKVSGNPPLAMSQRVAKYIKDKLNELPFKDFFDENTSLVPVPKSSLMKPDSLWVPLAIASAISKHGLGQVCSCLTRRTAVQKAAYSSMSKGRPKAIDHYNSIQRPTLLKNPKKIVLIDDIITQCATLLMCASILRETFPDVPIKGFAIIRTISNPDEFSKIRDSCAGDIKLLPPGKTSRLP